MKQRRKQNLLTSWDDLIHDAKRQITDARGRISLLKKTLKNLEQLRDSGQRWPDRAAKT
jgi:hypothetical protein